MHTLEERIQRLETSCRRWRLLTLAAVGLTVAHFAMRAPLEAQSQTTPKEIRAEGIKADTIICSSLLIQEKLDDFLTLKGSFRMNTLRRVPAAELSIYSEKGLFVVESEPTGVPSLKFEHDRDHSYLTAEGLSFKRETQEAVQAKAQHHELSVKFRKKGITDTEYATQSAELNKRYLDNFHESVFVGTDKFGGGNVFVENALGVPVVSLYADNKNCGQLLIGNADKEVLHALPPGKRK